MTEFEPALLSAYLGVHPFTFLLSPSSANSIALAVSSCLCVTWWGPAQASRTLSFPSGKFHSMVTNKVVRLSQVCVISSGETTDLFKFFYSKLYQC